MLPPFPFTQFPPMRNPRKGNFRLLTGVTAQVRKETAIKASEGSVYPIPSGALALLSITAQRGPPHDSPERMGGYRFPHLPSGCVWTA